MIELRAPRLEELPRLREFMPLAFGFGASPICETAIIRETGALAGGWAFHLVDSQTKEACFFWRLNDEWLGSELPGTMMERLTAAARTAGATRLLRVRMVPEASPDARLLAANGFEIGHEVEWFEGDLAELWKRIERAWPEFERRGLPRMEARGIEERFLPEIRRLVLEQELVPEF
jgi:hypothetical protein